MPEIPDELIATCYQLRAETFPTVTFERMVSPHYAGVKWAIRNPRNDTCLNRDGEWEFEPRPSERDAEFYAACRYDSLAEALAFYKQVHRDTPLR